MYEIFFFIRRQLYLPLNSKIHKCARIVSTLEYSGLLILPNWEVLEPIPGAYGEGRVHPWTTPQLITGSYLDI